jgi:hypothetical protein
MNYNIPLSKPLGCYLRSIYENSYAWLLVLERDESRPYLSLKFIFSNKRNTNEKKIIGYDADNAIALVHVY